MEVCEPRDFMGFIYVKSELVFSKRFHISFPFDLWMVFMNVYKCKLVIVIVLHECKGEDLLKKVGLSFVCIEPSSSTSQGWK